MQSDPNYCEANVPRALALIEEVPWDTLSALSPSARNASIDQGVASGLYLASWYRSTQEAPSLIQCLEGVLYQLVLVKMSRFDCTSTHAVHEWLSDARHRFTQGLPVSVYAQFRLQADRFVLEDLIDVALGYWVEAAQAHDAVCPARSWPALAQASLYLGLVLGPTYAIESGKTGGLTRGAKFDPLKEEILKLLRAYPDNHFPDLKHAREAITPQLKAFCDAYRDNRSTSLDQYLKRSSQQSSVGSPESSDILDEFRRVARKTGPGRPSKNLLAE